MRAAQTAEELRAAQAVLMPLLGYSLDDTATVLGRSRHWVSSIRNRTMRGEKPPGPRGGRRQAILQLDEEATLVKEGILQRGVWPGERKSLRAYLRDALSAQSESPPSESTVTALLDRAAPQLLQNRRARGTDLVQLANRLADLWRWQETIAGYLADLEKQ